MKYSGSHFSIEKSRYFNMKINIGGIPIKMNSVNLENSVVNLLSAFQIVNNNNKQYKTKYLAARKKEKCLIIIMNKLFLLLEKNSICFTFNETRSNTELIIKNTSSGFKSIKILNSINNGIIFNIVKNVIYSDHLLLFSKNIAQEWNGGNPIFIIKRIIITSVSDDENINVKINKEVRSSWMKINLIILSLILTSLLMKRTKDKKRKIQNQISLKHISLKPDTKKILVIFIL